MKTFVEENKTIGFIETIDNETLICVHDYSDGYEKLYWILDYNEYDIEYVIDMYKNGTLQV